MSTLIVSSLLIVSFLLTMIVKVIVDRKNYLDKPNTRSMHQELTPTLGGIAIVISFLLGLSAMYFAHKIELNLTLSLIPVGLILAIISLMDDIKPIAVKYRLSVHILIAFFVSYHLGGFSTFEWNMIFIPTILGTLIIIFSMNMVNFMDGIDGLVTLEVIFIAVAMVFLLVEKDNIVEARYFALLAAVMTGFLAWNFSPAQIFMGDVGSIFLGFVLAILMLHTTNNDLVSFWSWLILSAVFWIDVGFVLLVRLFTKKNISQAHRTHFYQKVTLILEKKKSRTYSHRIITIIISLVNVLWLFPLAYLAQYQLNYGPIILLIACSPLVFLVWYFKAGRV